MRAVPTARHRGDRDLRAGGDHGHHRGVIVEVARGQDGRPYSWLGAIGGLAYLAAIIVLRIRG